MSKFKKRPPGYVDRSTLPDKLSKYFSLDEMLKSETADRFAIHNVPEKRIVHNMMRLCATVDRLRMMLGYPIYVTSGYRCAELNRRVGGQPTSQHMSGLAMDFVCYKMEVNELYDYIRKHVICLGIDQLINEERWIHLSIPFINREPRMMAGHIGSLKKVINV